MAEAAAAEDVAVVGVESSDREGGKDVMNNLPAELLDYIVAKKIDTLPDAMLVCKKWYEIIARKWLCNDKLFWRFCDTNEIAPGSMMNWRHRSSRYVCSFLFFSLFN